MTDDEVYERVLNYSSRCTYSYKTKFDILFCVLIQNKSHRWKDTVTTSIVDS